jgi:hypothetical protein
MTNKEKEVYLILKGWKKVHLTGGLEVYSNTFTSDGLLIKMGTLMGIDDAYKIASN